ncbi:hypothetical protein MBLNU230_g3701t1 [Neophaeotheca triangularis]
MNMQTGCSNVTTSSGLPSTDLGAAAALDVSPRTGLTERSAMKVEDVEKLGAAGHIVEVKIRGEIHQLITTTPTFLAELKMKIIKKRGIADDDYDIKEEGTELEDKACSIRRRQWILQNEINRLEKREDSSERDDLACMREAYAKLVDELLVLQKQRESLDECLHELRARACHLYLGCLDTFDDVLVTKGMLEPLAAESPTKGHQGVDEGPSSGSVEPHLRRKESSGDLRSQNSSEEEGEGQTKALLSGYQHALRTLRYCENYLKERSDEAFYELHDRLDMLEAGEEVESEQAFAVRQFRETQKATQDVIAAEERYLAARAAAIHAGVKPGSEVESGFADDTDDGYSLSLEDELIRCVNRGSIERWLKRIPSVAVSSKSAGELDLKATPMSSINSGAMDDWDLESMSVWETWSNKANGDARTRIDDWRVTAELAYYVTGEVLGDTAEEKDCEGILGTHQHGDKDLAPKPSSASSGEKMVDGVATQDTEEPDHDEETSSEASIFIEGDSFEEAPVAKNLIRQTSSRGFRRICMCSRGRLPLRMRHKKHVSLFRAC